MNIAGTKPTAAIPTRLDTADLTVVVGDGPVWGVPEPSAPGSFHPYGADVEVTLDITPGVPHVFQTFYPILDEAAAALDRAGRRAG